MKDADSASTSATPANAPAPAAEPAAHSSAADLPTPPEAPPVGAAIAGLPREKLLELLANYARNWLAHDGLWFQAVEAERGMAEAIAHDATAWNRFSPIEARRIKRFLDLPERGGLEALRQALDYRLYAMLNRQSSVLENGRLRFWMNDCRVQSARQRKGLPDFPCRPVGEIEYQRFAAAIDPRIRCRCLACPPDRHPDSFYCGWEFWVDEEAADSSPGSSAE